MKKTFVAVLLAALMLAVMGVTMSLASPGSVSVTKTVSNPTAYLGGLITYTIVISNNTPANLALVDLIPNNTTYVAHTVSPLGQTGYASGNGTIELPGSATVGFTNFIWYEPISGTLSAGARVTVTLTVKVNAGVTAGTVITNVADYYVNDSVQIPSNMVSTTVVWHHCYLPIVSR
jgi:uncharacterized repeat protein (TIGR01451 family)